tara:strand:- start:3224 stop:4441 length:1218 start_codon:yes stop_codon:yes gene_type:complete
MRKIFFILILFLISCQLPDNNTEYQEGLVVFGRIELVEINGTAIGEIDPVRVSLSSEIDANIGDTESLYINDAIVTITGAFDQDESNIRTITLNTIDDLGQYVVDENEEYKIWPNSNYTLNVIYEDYTVSGTTTTPNYLTIESIEDNYNCEQCSDPTIYGETTCENSDENWTSEEQYIPPINVANFDFINNATNGLWTLDPNLLEPYVNDATISSIELSRYGCSVGSFASKPYFVLDIDDQAEEGNPNLSAIRILSYALEDKKIGQEPWTDFNDNGIVDEKEFFDYNQNEIRDETLINTFYDTTDVFKIWKGPYFRDENYNPYLINPFLWTVETSPSPIMWLYFNYYGKHLIVIQSSDDAYYDYLSGDPLGQNQYILPDSNIEGGYGLFTSNYSKAFFININKAD